MASPRPPASVSWTVTGTNDVPVVTGAVTGTATEDAATSTLSALANASDVDAGTTLNVVNIQSSLPAGVTYDAATKSFTLDPSHAAYQSLALNATTTVTVTYAVSDGITSTPASVSWTVTGTNDGAQIGNPTVAVVTEDAGIVGGNLVAEGSLSISDADMGQAVFSTIVTPAAGTLGSLTLAADGTYRYTVANSAVQSLGADQTKVETFAVASVDGTTKNISFTINGVNDLPALTGTAATLTGGTEDTAYTVTRAQLLAGWSDAENQTLTIVDPSVTNGTISGPDANGNYTITPNANYHGQITVNYSVSDGSAGGAASYSANGLVGFYRFNDQNNLGLDSSGNGNNLVVKGTTANAQYTSSGAYGGGLNLTGSAYLSTSTGQVPTGFPLGSSSYTLSVWFKDTLLSGAEGLIGYGNYGAGNQVNAPAD